MVYVIGVAVGVGGLVDVMILGAVLVGSRPGVALEYGVSDNSEVDEGVKDGRP